MKQFEPTAPSLPIAADEPVVVIRASDTLGPGIIRKLAFMLRARGGGEFAAVVPTAEELEAFADEMEEWQHAEGHRATWGALDPEPSPPTSRRKRKK